MINAVKLILCVCVCVCVQPSPSRILSGMLSSLVGSPQSKLLKSRNCLLLLTREQLQEVCGIAIASKWCTMGYTSCEGVVRFSLRESMHAQSNFT